MNAVVQPKVSRWRFDGAELNDDSLVGDLAHYISVEFSVGKAKRISLELILAEAITNSIDHGILELNSSLKKDPQGFEEYFVSRASKLADLQHGSIYVSAEQLSNDLIRITVQDSGNGFDHPQVSTNTLVDNLCRSYGRGVLIMRDLCESMVYIGNGNCVVLDFRI